MKRTRLTAFSNVPLKSPRNPGPKATSEEEETVDTLESLIKILKKPSNQRNSRSLLSLINFVKDIKFFKQLSSDLSEDAVAQCCLHMTYEYHRQDEVRQT